MNYKKAAWMSAFLAGALVLAGCQSDSDTEDTTSAVNTNTSAVKQSSTLSLEAEDYDTEINDAQKISLDEQSGDVKIKKGRHVSAERHTEERFCCRGCQGCRCSHRIG